MKIKLFSVILVQLMCLCCAAGATQIQPDLGMDIPKLEIAWTLSDQYGEVTHINDIPHYVQGNGMTSVPVQEDSGIVWLQEESNGTSAWFGLDNSGGKFEEDSRFYVQWLNQNEQPDEWNEYYRKLDDAHKAAADNLQMFRLGVRKPDGEERYENIGNTKVYVQLGDRWNQNDLHACYLSAGTDEAVSLSVENVERYDTTDAFAVLDLKHFSPYALYDRAAAGETAHAAEPPQTGDASNVLLWAALAATSAAGMTLLARKRKKA